MADKDPEPSRLEVQDPATLVTQRERAADSRMLRGVRWRLVLFSGGATLLVLVLLGAAIYTAMAHSLSDYERSQVVARKDQIVAFLQGARGQRPPDLSFGNGASGIVGYVIHGDDVVGPTLTVTGLPDPTSVAAARANGSDERLLTVRDDPSDDIASADLPVRILSVALPGADGETVVQVIQDRSAEQQTLDLLLAVLVGGGIVAVLAATMLGAVYARRALIPIRSSLSGRRDALRRQREFAADASHELRTPLTIVRASVEHLRLHPDEPVSQVGTALNDIEAEAAHLAALVDDLLLLARSDSGALDISLQPTELGDVAADAALAMAAPAAARAVQVRVDPEPAMVMGDPVRLRQLVTILLDNAVRHSPLGAGVNVRVRRDLRHAVLTVEDEGPGIAADDLPHVFDRFWRAAGETAAGTGLGLAIAATIVTRLGGRIGVADRTGGGAVFTVVLPLLQPGARVVRDPASVS